MVRSHVRRTAASLPAVAFAALVATFALLTPAASDAGMLFGLRAGASVKPDQFVAGVHLKTPNVAKKLEFMPSAEVGFGDDETSFALNGDFKYHLIPDRALDPYAGLGITGNWFDGNGEVGFNFVGGIHLAHRLFVEAKVGLSDEVPDAKFMGGLTF